VILQTEKKLSNNRIKSSKSDIQSADGGCQMQIVFNTNQNPKDYVEKGGSGAYPESPERCPHPSCGLPLRMSKNGYYSRYIITASFAGQIRIRRYKCKKCGHTVSMLPSFCMAQYSYGTEVIVGLMSAAMMSTKSKAAVDYHDVCANISRKQVRFYLSRLRKNRVFIEYGLNQISPGGASSGEPPGDIEWTEGFLCGKKAPRFWAETNAKFQATMGKSFMSTYNKIA
jgi:transposase-like protein